MDLFKHKKSLGTHLRLFLYDLLKNWSIQEHFFDYAHNSQPLSRLLFHTNLYEEVFHTQPHNPMNFQSNLSRNIFRGSTLGNRSCLLPPSHYQGIDLYRLFHSNKLKPIPAWFLAIETALLHFFSKVYQNALLCTCLHMFVPFYKMEELHLFYSPKNWNFLLMRH